MTFPWKKTKGSRISRLVADLQSPKRGGSLVVETGFPTSLVDLFVKNRDRLRENKKKKKSATARQTPAPAISQMQSESSLSDLKIMNLSSENSTTFDCNEDNVLRQDKEQDHDVGFCDYVEEKRKLNNGFEKSFDFDDGSRSKSVLIASLKVFVVVALALSTRKLAVGITMSAFALLFLEYAGKHLTCLQGCCSKPIVRFNSLIQRVVSVIMNLFAKKEIGREELVVLEESDLVCGRESNSSIDEIESVESESAPPDVAKLVEEVTTELDKRLEHRRSFVEIKHGDDVGHKSRHSWHGKSIKAKFVKKLVPKKLRSSKECKDKPRFTFSGQVVCETSLKIDDHENCESNQGLLSQSQSEVLDDESAGSEEGSFCSEERMEITNLIEESPMAVTNSKRYNNSGMALLVLVVLAGLGFGWGRLLAMVVTVAGYSISAFVEKLRRDQTSKSLKCS